MKKYIFVFIILLISLEGSYSQELSSGYKLNPPKYVCYRSSQEIEIDGEIYGTEWNNAQWSDKFVDIRGYEFKKKPIYPTRMKMMWDDNNLYIAAELIEPHIWATLTSRDATIYFDNDFEVFIDPDGDTHNYYEFEINAFGTEWDLMMTKPYHVGGTYINGYRITGLKTAVKHYGTINTPSDIDQKWVVEMKIPFNSLINRKAESGETWRMNFSRVEWLKVEQNNNKYTKLKGKEGFGNEENWVWAPTGVVDIHRPEYWGFVYLSPASKASSKDDFVVDYNDEVKFALRKLLNLQNSYFKKHNKFATKIKNLTSENFSKFFPTFATSGNHIVISATSKDGATWSISSDSRVWKQ